MNPRWTVFSTLIMLALPWGLWAQSKSVHITTDVGNYQVLKLTGISDPFELTDSLQYGVAAKSDSGSSTAEFRSFEVASPQTTSATIQTSGVQAWCVIGEQLFIGTHGKLHIRRLPQLELVKEIVLAAAPAGEESSPGPLPLSLAAAVNRQQNVLLVNDVSPLAGAKLPMSIQLDDETMRLTAVDEFRNALIVERVAGRAHSVSARISKGFSAVDSLILRVPGGWYCDGYVFDNSGSKLIYAFYFRSAKPARPTIDQIQRTNFGNRSNPINSEIALITVPAALSIETSEGPLTLRLRGQDGGLNPLGDRIPIDPSTASIPGLEFKHARVDEGDCTFLLYGNAGYHLRINRFDTVKADFLSPLRLRLVQPAMTLDGDHSPSNFRFFEPDEPTPPVAVTIPDRQSLDLQAKSFFQGRFAPTGITVESFRQKLEEYVTEANREFLATVGRPPKGIPVPHWITAKLTWPEVGQTQGALQYCVWGEWTERAILDLLFRETFAQQRQLESASRQQQLELERQRQEQARAEEERRRAEEKRLQIVARNRKEIEASFSTRLNCSSALGVLALIMAILFRWFNRAPKKSSSPVASCLFLVAAFFHAPQAIAADPTESDGDGVVAKLPFAPSHVYISPHGKWGVVRRDGPVLVAGKSETTFAVVDLERLQVMVERKFAESTTQLFVSRDFLLAVFASSQRLVAMSLPDLKEIASRQLDQVDAPVMLVADRFVDLTGRARWEAPNLIDVAGEWAHDSSTAGKWGSSARTYRTEEKWFVDGFQFSQDLREVVAFCGHPQLFQSTVIHVNRSQPSPTTTVDGRRLAPFLKSLSGSYISTGEAWRLEVVAPMSFRYLDSTGSTSANANTSQPQLWVRLQAVLPEKQNTKSASQDRRLLARIRVDLPGVTLPELYGQNINVPMNAAERKCLAAVGQNLVVFTLSQSAWDRLPKLPRIVDRCIPVVIDHAATTTLDAQLSTGVPIERVTGSCGPLQLTSASSRIAIDPGNILKQFGTEPFFESLSGMARVSPRASLEEWASSFRARSPAVIQRLEKLAGRTIQGIPLSVPLQLKVIGKDQSSVEIGRCIIIDVSPELFRDLFQQKQTRRLARLVPPSQTIGVHKKLGSPIDLVSAEPLSPDAAAKPEPAAPEQPEPAKAADPSSALQPPIEKGASGPLTEIAANLIFSIVAGAAFIAIGCRMYRRGIPAEESFVAPGWRQIVVTTLVIGLVVAACETLLVVWGRKCIQLESWPSWLAVMIVLILALTFRFVMTVIGIKTMLRLAINETAEIMLFVSLLAFIPTTMFLSGLFAITVLG